MALRELEHLQTQGERRDTAARAQAMNIRPRIGIDMHVVDGIYQGSRTHCIELFSRVIASTPECDFILFCHSPEFLRSCHPSFRLPNASMVAMPSRSSISRLLWQLPMQAWRQRLDLLHLQYIAPPVLTCASAVTVHDVLYETHPQFFERFFVVRSRLLIPYSIRRSAMTFTVSEYSKHSICQTYSLPREDVRIAFDGVDTERFFPGDEGRQEVCTLGLTPGTYYLIAGRIEPRKNHLSMVQAWARLQEPRPPLVIVGQRHFSYSAVFNLIRDLGVEDQVHVLDHVSDEMLPALYRHARAFLYCSWAEGFGMPALEAMASGTAVIASNTTSLPEICADAALLVDPASVDEIVKAMEQLDTQPELKSDYIRRGLQQASRFTWDAAAWQVRAAYMQHFGLRALA